MREESETDNRWLMWRDVDAEQKALDVWRKWGGFGIGCLYHLEPFTAWQRQGNPAEHWVYVGIYDSDAAAFKAMYDDMETRLLPIINGEAK